MSAFQIKLIAIITMIIDHLGLFFFPDIFLLRVIGRLSFPLFAWLIANGALYTKNVKAYLARLFIAAAIAQIPYIFAYRQTYPDIWNLNILFTLFLGLAAIVSHRSVKNRIVSISCVLVCAVLGGLLQTDYGAFGVLSIVFFYLTFRNIAAMILLQGTLVVVFYVLPAVILIYGGQPIQNVLGWLSQLAGLISLGFIFLYNHQEGLKTKYLLYLFYPIQFVVIWIMKLTLEKI